MALPRPTLLNSFPIRIISAFIILSVFTLSCKKNAREIMDLKFPLTTYYVSDGGEIILHINSGNKEYSLSVGDEKLVKADADLNDWPAGTIQIKGLKKGSTQLTIKDEVSRQEVVLQIHVVDPYLVMKAAHNIPIIAGTDSKNEQLIRDEIKGKSQDFSTFEEQDILILQRNADHQFSIFKSEEDVARGIVHRSGNYTLDFHYDAPNTLILNYADTEKTDNFILHAHDSKIFAALLDFSLGEAVDKNERAITTSIEKQSSKKLKVGSPQSTSPVIDYSFYLVKDFTSYFKTNYLTIERVDLVHAMNFYPSSHHLSFGENILK